VLGDHGAEPLGEGGLGGDERLLDVLAGVMARREEDVVVGVIGAGTLEDLEVDLLADLGVHLAVDLPRRRRHQHFRMRGRARRVNSKVGVLDFRA
jgi:hypothetical protein